MSHGRDFIVYCCIVAFGLSVRAENFGLRDVQPAEQLPRSAGKIPAAGKRLAHVDVPVANRLMRAGCGEEWCIAGGWQLIEDEKVFGGSSKVFDPSLDVSGWYDAVVPGTVLQTLVAQGIYPDPYYGLNNLSIPDALCRKVWLYRVVFDAPALWAVDRRAWLDLNGVNYRADVYLNEARLGDVRGAFSRGVFDVSGTLKAKGNVLAVRISPPPNPGLPHEESQRSGGQGPNGGQLCLDGPTFISSEGWDWVPGIRDRNVGLWQDVRLRVTGDVALRDPQVITDLPLPSVDRAELSLRATVKSCAPDRREVMLVAHVAEWLPGGQKGPEVIQVRQPFILEGHEARRVELDAKSHAELVLSKPKLWWPNGYGAPNMYVATLSVESADGRVSDVSTVRFGVRELSYVLSVDTPTRKDWRVELNPLKVYAKGKPAINNLDRREVSGSVCVPKVIAGFDESLLETSDDAAMGPFLVIKVNGVPVFCRGGNWGMDDAMKRISRARLEPAVRLHRDAGFNMVRNWTGESTEPAFFDLCDEYGLLVWNDFWYSTQGYNLEPNDHALFMENVKETVLRYRNHPSLAIWCPRNEGWANEKLDPQIAAVLAREDPSRHYQGNSRLQNLRASGPWNFFDNVADYYAKIACGFSTELGNFAVPPIETVKSFIPAEDLWPIGDVWYYHDFHAEHNQQVYRKAIAQRYGEPADAEAFCRRAQMVNYESFRAMFESWNSRLWNNASGLLLWMSHPAWPSMIWQLYAYDFETTGAYFGAKKACEAVHAQMNAHDSKVVVLNVTRLPLKDAQLKLECFGMDGLRIGKGQCCVVSVAANSKTDGFVADLPARSDGPVLARLTLSGNGGEALSVNDYWLPGKAQFQDFAKVKKAELNPTVTSLGDKRCSVRLKNSGASVAGAIRLQLVDRHSGERVLPAYFSDGWFNLLPGEEREIILDGWRDGVAISDCKIIATCQW